MNHLVQVLEIDHETPPTVRGLPTATFTIAADTHAQARQAALARFAADGRTVRSLTSLSAGGMVAVVAQSEAAQVLRARGDD